MILLIIIVSSPFLGAETKELNLSEAINQALRGSPEQYKASLELKEKEDYMSRVFEVGEEDLIEEVETEYKKAKKNYDQQQKAIIEETRQKYFQILQTEERLNSAEEDLEQKNKQLEIDEKKFALNLISELELEKSRQSVRKAETKLKFTEKNLETQYQEFNQFLGQELDTEIELNAKQEPEVKEIEESLEEAQKLALKNRSDINDLEEKLAEAQSEVKNLDNEYTPQIEIKEAKNRVKKLELEYQQKEKSLLIQTRKQYFDLQQEREAIENAKQDLEIARKEKEEAQLKYDADKISTREMISAQNRLTEAEEKLIESKWSYHEKRIEFLEYIGVWGLEDSVEIYEMPAEPKEQTGDEHD